MRHVLLLAMFAALVGVGLFCRSAETAADKPPNKEFADRLLGIAKEYESFGRVDDESRWAPWLCRLPNPSQARASLARVSESGDGQTHGGKLYFIFAKDRGEYLGRDPKRGEPSEAAKKNAPHPVGQVIVKESWVPEKVPAGTTQAAVASSAGAKPAASGAMDGPYVPYAKKGSDLYHAREKAGLFIMFKLAQETPDTDQGWVYGTVSADGKKVTSAGRLSSCMQCHEKAPRDRLFGMKYDGL